jgi:hypothetical protein
MAESNPETAPLAPTRVPAPTAADWDELPAPKRAKRTSHLLTVG